PAEPQQRERCDIFAYASASRTAFIRGGTCHGRSLHHIEVVQQADPGDGGNDVDPARQAELVELDRRDTEGDGDGDDDAKNDGAGDRSQRVHAASLPRSLEKSRLRRFFQNGSCVAAGKKRGFCRLLSAARQAPKLLFCLAWAGASEFEE